MDLKDHVEGMPLEDQFDRDGIRRLVEELFSPEQTVIVMRLFDLSELHRSVINRNVELQSGAGQEMCKAIALLSEAVDTLSRQVAILIMAKDAEVRTVKNADGCTFSHIITPNGG